MTDELQKHDPQEETSVLDYLKSLFRFGIGEKIQLPGAVEQLVVSAKPQSSELYPSTPFPWSSLFALFFALIAQNAFEPPPLFSPGYAFYFAAFILLLWAIQRGEWNLEVLKPTADGTDPLTYRLLVLIVSELLMFWAFVLFRDNLFTITNVFIWLVSIFLFIIALWAKSTNDPPLRIANFFKINSWTLPLIAATALILFFRFDQMARIPPEPFSDHAEKILDVYDITQGETRIFFPRNTGREGFQMYWTLLISQIFGTGLSFLSLKLGTAILGFLTLPFVYLLGKEIGGQRVALFAFILAGIGYWSNVISRVGLRFPLYPLFVAPTLLYLIRGLRTRNRNDFLLSGLFLGLGLHGYSPMRIVPFVVIAAFVLYGLHSQSKGVRKDLPVWLTILGLTSLVVFLPLLNYWLYHPAKFGYRAFTRLSGTEQALSGPAYQIFISNFWNALKMFNFDDGNVWVNSVTGRPALDVVTAALFALGVILVLVRYLRNRHWLDLFLLMSIPLLQLPSSLSLAFPGENPALNRAGAAYIPAFIIGAMALDGLLTSFGRGRMRSFLKWGMAGILLFVSASQNYDLVFNQYYNSFRQAVWNSTDMGEVTREFGETYGTTDNVWIVPFPFWVDTRLPAIWVGTPNRDMAMWRNDLPTTLELGGPKLFMVKADLENPNEDDVETLYVLRSLYPNGQQRLFDSDVPGHDFWIYFVPDQ